MTIYVLRSFKVSWCLIERSTMYFLMNSFYRITTIYIDNFQKKINFLRNYKCKETEIIQILKFLILSCKYLLLKLFENILK